MLSACVPTRLLWDPVVFCCCLYLASISFISSSLTAAIFALLLSCEHRFERGFERRFSTQLHFCFCVKKTALELSYWTRAWWSPWWAAISPISIIPPSSCPCLPTRYSVFWSSVCLLILCVSSDLLCVFWSSVRLLIFCASSDLLCVSSDLLYVSSDLLCVFWSSVRLLIFCVSSDLLCVFFRFCLLLFLCIFVV